MPTLAYARQRVRAVLREIAELADSDFPYGHSRDALKLLDRVFQDRLDVLEGLDERNVESTDAACSESLLRIFDHLPLLGFILRSTNVRNSFEVHGPLLKLSRQILGPDTKLILSSEWTYFPHVYRPIPDLPGFVLLGFPASESGNPLLIPLAGHELGHTTWQSHELDNHFGRVITRKIKELAGTGETWGKEYRELFGGDSKDLFFTQNLEPAFSWARRQAEESFCDFFGVRLFAESYLSAFAYVLAPGIGRRTPTYPSQQNRVTNLVEASRALGFAVPDGFPGWFTGETAAVSEGKEGFWIRLADAVVASLVDDLIEKAREIADSSNVPIRSPEKIKSIVAAFKVLTPASGIGNLTSILNAAWQVSGNHDMWEGTENDHVETLGELVLKSIEILEFEERTRQPE